MDPRPLPTLLIVAVFLLAVAGCGEKDEPMAAGPTASSATTSTTTSSTATSTTSATDRPLTAAAYIAAADDLCSAAMAEQEAQRRERGGKQITLRDRARLLVLLAPPRVELAEQLGRLEPPKSLEEQAQKLVASAERRGEASTEAGRLYESDGSKEKIAAAAAAEHDERELAVEIARGMGMAECAEILPPKAADEVEAAIQQGLGSQEPAKRCAVTGQRYLAELYGGGEAACIKADADAWEPGAVAVSDIEGMDAVFAQAVAEVRGGGEATEYRVRLTYEDGAYKIDKLD